MKKGIRTSFIATVGLMLICGCASLDRGSEDGPRAVLDAFLSALNRADIDGLERLFAPDATAFLPFGESVTEMVGWRAIRDSLEPMFAEMRASGVGPEYMHLTAKDVHVRFVDSVAIVTFDAGSGPVISRRTIVAARIGSAWKIQHFHGSNIRKER